MRKIISIIILSLFLGCFAGMVSAAPIMELPPNKPDNAAVWIEAEDYNDILPSAALDEEHVKLRSPEGSYNSAILLVATDPGEYSEPITISYEFEVSASGTYDFHMNASEIGLGAISPIEYKFDDGAWQQAQVIEFAPEKWDGRLWGHYDQVTLSTGTHTLTFRIQEEARHSNFGYRMFFDAFALMAADVQQASEAPETEAEQTPEQTSEPAQEQDSAQKPESTTEPAATESTSKPAPEQTTSPEVSKPEIMPIDNPKTLDPGAEMYALYILLSGSVLTLIWFYRINRRKTAVK